MEIIVNKNENFDYVGSTTNLDMVNKIQLHHQYVLHPNRTFLFDHTYFENRDCIFFPCPTNELACHNGVDVDRDGFNCMQCRCAAYNDSECPGMKRGLGVILSNGLKDCSNCHYNHDHENRVEMSTYFSV